MMNAMVADLCSAQGKTGEGELAQQYGKLGACGVCVVVWWYNKKNRQDGGDVAVGGLIPRMHACMHEFT